MMIRYLRRKILIIGRYSCMGRCLRIAPRLSVRTSIRFVPAPE